MVSPAVASPADVAGGAGAQAIRAAAAPVPDMILKKLRRDNMLVFMAHRVVFSVEESSALSQKHLHSATKGIGVRQDSASHYGKLPFNRQTVSLGRAIAKSASPVLQNSLDFPVYSLDFGLMSPMLSQVSSPPTNVQSGHEMLRAGFESGFCNGPASPCHYHADCRPVTWVRNASQSEADTGGTRGGSQLRGPEPRREPPCHPLCIRRDAAPVEQGGKPGIRHEANPPQPERTVGP